MNHEKYLVTGAAGFIGANLTRQLIAEGKDIYPLVRPGSNLWRLESEKFQPSNLIQVDVTDYQSLREQLLKVKPTHIFHLASYGIYRNQRDDIKIFNTNALGTINLLRVSQELDLAAIINTGSVFEYGNLAGAQTENAVGSPRQMYDAAKITSTQMAKFFASEYRLPICTLRLFTPYGPYEDRSRLVSSVILSMLDGHQPQILSPRSVRDFIYVSDVVSAYIDASQRKNWSGEVINIGSGEPHSTAQVVDQIAQVLGIDPPVLDLNIPTVPSDSRSWADISLAEALLNWRPRETFTWGLEQTIQWFINHRHHYQR